MTERSLAKLLADLDDKLAGILAKERSLRDYSKLDADIAELVNRFFDLLSFCFVSKHAKVWSEDALIGVTYGSKSYTIPVPELEHLAPEISHTVRRKIMKTNVYPVKLDIYAKLRAEKAEYEMICALLSRFGDPEDELFGVEFELRETVTRQRFVVYGDGCQENDIVASGSAYWSSKTVLTIKLSEGLSVVGSTSMQVSKGFDPEASWSYMLDQLWDRADWLFKDLAHWGDSPANNWTRPVQAHLQWKPESK